jgi:hypothetical protein
MDLKKFAENKAKREEGLYSLEEDWSVYGPNCADHPGVRKLLVGEAEKAKLGYKKSALVWKCPEDGKVTAAEGSIAEQTDGFASMNNLHRNKDEIVDGAFQAAKDLAKAMGYTSDGPKSN